MAEEQRTRMPFWMGLKRRFMKRFQSRVLRDFEWSISFSENMRELTVHFFAERTPLVLELSYQGEERVAIENIKCGRGDDLSTMEYVFTEGSAEQFLVLSVEPMELSPVNRIVLHLTSEIGELPVKVQVRVMEEPNPDLIIVSEGHRLAGSNELEAAIDRLRAYEDYSTENPLVCFWIADWYRQLKDLDQAQDYAAKAIVHGNQDAIASFYRNIEEEREPTPIEDLRRLQDDARQWPLGDHHGVVALDKRQRFSMNLNGFQLRKCRSVLEIRRAEAGRMLTRVEFPFSAARELLLQTSLRVIHPDGEVEEIPIEHFSIRDHERRNPYITTEQEKAGFWILPDLACGDLIEWTYAVLHRDHPINGRPQAFVLNELFDQRFPTFHAKSRYIVPVKEPIRFAYRNLDITPSRKTDGDRKIYDFEGSHFVPARQTGFIFENDYLNPIIACAADGIEWPAVSRQAQLKVFGEGEISDELPSPLLDLVRQEGTRVDALERAFYWIRDQVKYAAVKSGAENIGTPNRARKIIEAGVGDCKDKSYLLSLVCRELGFPYQLLLVSSKHGILVEQTPSDQFDHVFVRAEADGRWLYLDATNQVATFHSPPPWCQGLPALVLDEDGTIVEIPTDDPEANGLEITEVFDRCEDGRISGRFEIRGLGVIGRLMDERWKAISLSLDDSIQVGQVALGPLLPSSGITQYSDNPDTSASDHSHVMGCHSRGPLVILERQKHAILALSWNVPFLPIEGWRSLQVDRLFVVELPLHVRVVVRFQGELRHMVKDVSRVEPTDNEISRVEAEIRESEDALSISRTIVFKKKFVRGPELELVPTSLEQIEKALQVVLSCDPALV